MTVIQLIAGVYIIIDDAHSGPVSQAQKRRIVSLCRDDLCNNHTLFHGECTEEWLVLWLESLPLSSQVGKHETGSPVLVREFKSEGCVALQEQPESTWNLSRLRDDGLAAGGLRSRSTKIPFGEDET